MWTQRVSRPDEESGGQDANPATLKTPLLRRRRGRNTSAGGGSRFDGPECFAVGPREAAANAGRRGHRTAYARVSSPATGSFQPRRIASQRRQKHSTAPVTATGAVGSSSAWPATSTSAPASA